MGEFSRTSTGDLSLVSTGRTSELVYPHPGVPSVQVTSMLLLNRADMFSDDDLEWSGLTCHGPCPGEMERGHREASRHNIEHVEPDQGDQDDGPHRLYS